MATNLPTTTQLVLPANFGAPAKAFQGQQMEHAGDGIGGGFGVLSYGGKAWTLRAKGKDHTFMRADGDGQRGTVEVIFVRMSSTKAKTYYKGFKEGSRDKPLCWSNDAITPAKDVPPATRGHDNCSLCPLNQVGSRVTDAGKPARACSDHKRTAIILDPALLKEVPGLENSEPLLLRIPAASLNAFDTYDKALSNCNPPIPVQALVTRVGFVATEKFPQLTFSPVRALTEEEAAVVLALREDPLTQRILADQGAEHGTGDGGTTLKDNPAGPLSPPAGSYTANGGAGDMGATVGPATQSTPGLRLVGANGTTSPSAKTPTTVVEDMPDDLSNEVASLLG